MRGRAGGARLGDEVGSAARNVAVRSPSVVAAAAALRSQRRSALST
jgi:hypothetical protein